MLALTRKVGQRIQIPQLGITIQMGAIRGRAATILIEAPEAIRVLREELCVEDAEQQVERGAFESEQCG
jgi:carbon storage regulator CsrA